MERVGYEQLKQYAEWQEWDEPRGIQNDATMMARELLAYRQSGALEALKAIQIVTADDEDRVADGRWRKLWTLADKWGIYHDDLSDASRLLTRIAGAVIAKLEAI
jgi:hypothetical protein